VTDTPTPTPYATLLAFTRYLAQTGPAKANFVSDLRKRRTSRSGFNPDGRLLKALKADLRFGTAGTHLSAVVDTVDPRWRGRYSALVPGALEYLASVGPCQLVRTHEVLAMVGGLPVKINPQFGLSYPDGRKEAVRLHLDEVPPQPDAILATLHLMSRHMDQVFPGATPVLVDVRRGQIHRPDPAARPDRVERWLTGEAAAFAAVWSA